jgi:hypothetical protein
MTEKTSLAHKSEPVELLSFALSSISIQDFIISYWDSNDFYLKFSLDRLSEKHIRIAPWQKNISFDDRIIKYQRVIRKHHPLPFSLPWLPADVVAHTTQTIKQDRGKKNLFVISEHTIVKGIPYTEPHVIVHWIVQSSKENEVKCNLTLRFEYEQASLLRVAIESNAFVELTKYYKLYRNEIMRSITDNHRHRSHRPPTELTDLFLEEDDDQEDDLIGEDGNMNVSSDEFGVSLDKIPLNESSLIAYPPDFDDDLILDHEDIMLLVQLEPDEIEEIASTVLNQSYDDLINICLRERRRLYRNLSRGLLLVMIKVGETSSWCPYEYRVWSFLKIVIFLSLFYLLSLVIIASTRKYIIKRRDNHFSRL